MLVLAAAGHAEIIRETKGPTEDQVTAYVKERLASWFNFQCLEVKSKDVTDKKASFSCILTISPIKPLFLDATREALPELEGKTKVPEGIVVPTILKKGKGAREVLEVPVEVEFHWMKDRWEGISLEDKEQLSSFGKPQSEFGLNAAVFGSNEARSAISQFRKDMAKTSKKKQ
jgi:hypothetical protein